MKPNVTKPTGLALIPLVVLAVVLAGCGDDRLVEVTRDADRRQAEQNDQLANVVNQETAVRQQVAKLQNDLRADQAGIARERDQLETERREAASSREWAAFWTPLLEWIGVVVVVTAVLGYCGYMVHTLRNSGPADIVLAEKLVDQLLSVEQLPPPMLLPPDNDTQLLVPIAAGQCPASTSLAPRSPHVP